MSRLGLGLIFIIGVVGGYLLTQSKAPNQNNVLVVVAHPDDETMIAGTLVFLRGLGKHVRIVYMTDGEGGRVFRPVELGGYQAEEFPPEVMRTIRVGEMERALAELGISDWDRLGQPDIPLRDSEGQPSRNLEEFLNSGSWNVPLVLRTLREILDDYRPGLVITMGQGENYHAHHKAVGAITLVATDSLSYQASVYAISEHRWVSEGGSEFGNHEFNLDLSTQWWTEQGQSTLGEYVYNSIRNYQTQIPGQVGIPRDVEKIYLVKGPAYPSFSLDR